MINQNNAAQAIQEAERIAAADEYFKARAWLMDTTDNRRIFEAGFDRAYALLSKLRAPVAQRLRPDVDLSELAIECGAIISTDDLSWTLSYSAMRNFCTRARAALASASVADARQSWPRAGKLEIECDPDRFGPTPWHITDGFHHAIGATPNEALNRFHHHIASAPVAGEAQPGDYVQPVPDHCDRIVWRGRYYALGRTALLAREDAAPQASEAVLQTILHSVRQARIAGNDWRRELALIENTVSAALSAQPGAQRTGDSDA